MNSLVLQRIISAGLTLLVVGTSSTAVVLKYVGSDVEATTTVTSEKGQWYVVKSGDTLSMIAQRYGILIKDLVNANQIENPDYICVGQRLWIPSTTSSGTPVPGSAEGSPAASDTTADGEWYTIQAGDTLSRIATRFSVRATDLIRLNKISNPDLIIVGQRLLIPNGNTGMPAPQKNVTKESTAAPTGEAKDTTAEPTPAKDGQWYVVVSGDTLSRIAARFSVRMNDLVTANNIANVNVIRAGQRIWIPSGQGSTALSTTAVVTRTKTSTVTPTLTRTSSPTRAAATATASSTKATATATISPTRETITTTASPTPRPTLTTTVPITIQAGFDYGFQIDENGTALTQSIAAVQQAGFNWVKVQVPWYRIEPNRKGGFDWEKLDTLIGQTSTAGLQVLLSVSAAPDWARSPGTDYSVNGPPENPQDMADMLTALVERYRGHIQAIEVWSGQNLAFEWGYEELDPERYVALLCAAYQAIKSADPAIAVISGGLTPTGITAEGISADDLVYLRRMYADGCRACMDGLGAHPTGYNNPADADSSYTDPNEPTFKVHRSFYFQETMLAYHDLMVSYNDTKTLIWPTIVGWASSDIPNPGYEYAADVTEAEQAAYLVKAYQMMKAWGWVGPAFTWNLDYNLTDPDSSYAHFSVLGRPAYDSLLLMAK